MSDHRGIVDGDLRVMQDGTVSGIVQGDLTIAAGCRVTVSGMIEGSVIVEPGAHADVSGMVSGGIVDRGGTVRISGMVSSRS